MPTPRNVIQTGMSRVWLMEDGAGPTVAPEYMGVWKAGSPSKDYGEATAIEIPGDDQYDKFQEIASIAGAASKPTMGFTARYAQDLSDMLRLARRECYHDFQVHIGLCRDPQNFAQGWDKIVALESARISNWTTEDIGALASDERAKVNESITIQAKDLYEIKKLALAEVCGTSVIQEVVGVTFCDLKACGECGEVSDGCQKFFALVKAVGGSPGLGAQVVYSDDQGATCGATPITSLAANHDPDDIGCMGQYIIVVSEAGLGHHYALKEEILLGIETWQAVTLGYNVAGGPRCLWVLKSGYCWIGGLGGYVYFLREPTEQPETQDAGVATFEDLNDAHAYDEEHVLMVGNDNAVIHTEDGETWAPVTGPAPAVNLNCCWMRSETEWWVGDASGQLWYTRNSGLTWVEKQFPGSGAGQVRDIIFVTKQMGYLAHDTIAPAGRILRTIGGGYNWYVLPEGTGNIPANDRINSLAGCGEPNLVIGGGLADLLNDGILVKAS